MADYTNQIQKLYVAYFSRPADFAGLEYWNNVMNADPHGYQVISHQFATSAEYQATYGSLSHRDAINEVYVHLFGRSAETAGLDYWTPLLDNGAITIDNVVTQVAAGAQGSDLFAYNAKVAVSTSFTTHLDMAVEQKAYSGDHANKIAIDFIATVKDLASASAGMDPGQIDSVISHIVTDSGLSGASAPLVGVADAHIPGMGF